MSDGCDAHAAARPAAARSWVVAVVEDDEAGVHVMRGVLGVHADGVRVPARPRTRLEHGDLVLAVQQVGGGQPGDAGADDRDLHRLLLRATTRFGSLWINSDAAAEQPRRPVPQRRIRPDLRPRGVPGHLRPVDRAGRQARRAGGHSSCSRSGCTCCRRCAGGSCRSRSGIDLPYWADDPDFDLDFHVRETAIPAPGDDRQLAETVARVFGRPLDRGRPLWELYVIHGLDGRPRRAADQDPPLGRGRDLAATRSWPCCWTRSRPGGCSTPSPPANAPGAADPARPRDARARPARHPAPAAARAALAADDGRRASPTCPGANALPGVPTLVARLLAGAPDVRRPTRAPACSR